MNTTAMFGAYLAFAVTDIPFTEAPPAGAIWKANLCENKPVLTAETLEEIVQKAEAYVEAHPEVELLLFDSHGWYYESVKNWKFAPVRERVYNLVAYIVFFLIVVAIFAFTCSVALVVGLPFPWACVCFVCATSLWVLLVSFGIQNEGESAWLIEIVLILLTVFVHFISTNFLQ